MSYRKIDKYQFVVTYLINWLHLDSFDSIWNYLRDSISLSTFSPLITFKFSHFC